MTISVVSVQSALLGCATAFLPPTGVVISGAARTYFLYRLDSPGPHEIFRDLDGDTLTELRSFAAEAEAREWVAADIARRMAA